MVAEIPVLPAERPVATPALEIVATPELVELQFADVVTSCVVLSLSKATAENFTVPCTPVFAAGGSTVIETTVADKTVTRAVPISPPKAAVMVAAPGATAVTTPPETVATLVESEVHTACEVTSDAVWLEN